MSADTATTSTPHPPRFGVRSAFSVVVGLLAVVLLIATVLTVWAQAVAFNSDRFADSFRRALEQPEVIDSMSLVLADELMVALDADTFIDDVLPSQLDFLQPILSNGARALTARAADAVLSDPRTQDLLVSIAREGHAGVMRILSGDVAIPGVSVEDDTVSVNLLPLFVRALEAVQGLGLFTDVAVPQLPAGGDPAEDIAAVESALGRDLPDDFGQLVVYRGQAVSEAGTIIERAQETFRLVKIGSWLIYIATAVAFAGSLILARRRVRAGVLLGLGAAAALFVGRVVVLQAIDELPKVVANPGAIVAIGTTAEDLAGGLIAGMTLLAIAGLVVAVVLAVLQRASTGSIAGTTGVVPLMRRFNGSVAVAAFALAVLSIVLAGVGVIVLLIALALTIFGLYMLFIGSD